MRRDNGHGAIALDGRALTAAVCAVGAATAGKRLVIAVIPARDEERHLEVAIWSLRGDEPPDLIVVVCEDDCTDATRALADATGAVVFETEAKTHTTAGALAQALRALIPALEGHDAVVVLVLDASVVPRAAVGLDKLLRNE